MKSCCFVCASSSSLVAVPPDTWTPEQRLNGPVWTDPIHLTRLDSLWVCWSPILFTNPNLGGVQTGAFVGLLKNELFLNSPPVWSSDWSSSSPCHATGQESGKNGSKGTRRTPRSYRDSYLLPICLGSVVWGQQHPASWV